MVMYVIDANKPVDPTAVIQNIIDAVSEYRDEEAREYLEELISWHWRGGFISVRAEEA